jgi:hypothetical protein
VREREEEQREKRECFFFDIFPADWPSERKKREEEERQQCNDGLSKNFLFLFEVQSILLPSAASASYPPLALLEQS